MSSKPKFYLPVILPPLNDQSNPPAYYADIKALGALITADSGGSDGSLEIMIKNSNLFHPNNQFGQPRPFSTVFAPTSGFVRFYPGSAALPPPNQNPMAPPSNLTATDIGSVVIRVWVSNFLDFIKTPSSVAPSANRIVLGWLKPSTVRTAFTAEIAKMKDKVLKKSWEDAGGIGAVPDRAGLEAAFLQRFMAGDAEVFISAGAEIGSAVEITASLAKVKMQAFFKPEDPSALPVFVEADEVIDNATAEDLFTGHPLIEASNSPITIKFKSKFTIWNNKTSKYEALNNTFVTLMMQPPDDITVDSQITDSNGNFAVDFEAQLMKRDMIFFSYDTTGKTIGNRTFDKDVETEPHLARLYLNSAHENTREYQASDEIYPKYRDFIDELAANADKESFERDRGNAATWDTSAASAPVKYAFTYSSQKGFLSRIKDSEKRYKDSEIIPSKRFSLLLEGDSWLSYPPDGHGVFTQYSGDIYGQLDGLLSKYVEETKLATYIRFPLQHHGDRSDQMFVGDAQDPTRQWHFTREFLSEFKIDVVVCSAGGNDLAEPGISHWFLDPKRKDDNPAIANEFIKCFTDPTFDHMGNGGYFDPTKMGILSTDHQEQAMRMMEMSFAILLNDHPWNIFARETEPQKPNVQWKDLPGWNALGPASQSPSEIGEKVVQNIPEFTKLPDPDGDLQQKLLATVFDAGRYQARYQEAANNLRTLLTAVTQLQPGTPVLTHTYCYPLFRQDGTKRVKWQTGPWFAPRFKQAGITDFRIRFICLKALLDNYVYSVLEVLKNEFPGTFDYVDVRNKNASTARWADEMHLHSEGYEVIATRLYNKIAIKFGYPLVPETD